MNEFEKQLFKKGYIRLQQGSYMIWISKRWHEMFVRRGLVRKNFYGQWCAVKDSIPEYGRWCDLYDKLCHDRDFPKSNPFLTESEIIEIRQTII